MRPVIERLNTLNGIDFDAHFSQYARLVTGSGPHFEYSVFWPDLEYFSLESNRIRLRNRLFISNWEWHVTVCPFFESAVQKQVPGDVFHGLQYMLIGNTFLAQGLNKLAPEALVSVAVFLQG